MTRLMRVFAAAMLLAVAGYAEEVEEEAIGEPVPAQGEGAVSLCEEGDERPECSVQKRGDVQERRAVFPEFNLPMQIRNEGSGLCIRPSRGSKASGAYVSFSRCAGYASYYWVPERVGNPVDGWFMLKNLGSGFYLTRGRDNRFYQKPKLFGGSDVKAQYFTFESSPWPPWDGEFFYSLNRQGGGYGDKKCVRDMKGRTVPHLLRVTTAPCSNYSRRRWHRALF